MSSLRRVRTVALGLLLISAAVPARALSRSASLLWRFDDITARDPSGTRHRNSWYQGYNADLSGVLLHPFVGSFQAGGAYTQGAEVDTSVNQDIPEVRSVSWRAALQPLPPGVRRYFTLDPNYSLQASRYAASSTAGEHTYTNRSWGYGSNLNLPRLPSVSVARQYNALTDPNGPSPLDTRQNLMRESFYYRLRRVSLNASQERIRTDDLRSAVPVPVDKTQRGSLDYGRDFKTLGLRSITVRSDFLRTARNDLDMVKTVTNLVNLRSRDFHGRAWVHSINYWNDSRRDLLLRTTTISHNLQFNSSRQVRRGSITNGLSGSATTGHGGGGRGVALAPAVNLAFLGGRLKTATNAQAGLSRSALGRETFNDALGTRFDFAPRKVLALFAEAQMNGSEALGSAEGGQRTFRYSLGADRRFAQAMASARYDRIEQRDFASSGRAVSDQVNLTASATPLERLTATAGANYTTTRSDPGSRSESKNARGGLDYTFRWGLRLFADASYSGSEQYSANGGAGYTLGKTTLNLRVTQSQYSSSSSYTYMSVSLARSL